MIIKDIAVFWLQKFLSYISIALLLTSFSSCTHETNPNASISPDTIFFGDSTLTVISSNRPNGYLCKLFKSKDLVLLNLQRGDSINQYVPIHDIDIFTFGGIVGYPDSEWEIWADSCGVFQRPFNIPIEKQELGRGIFFMDVNFDGEDELVIEHPGYNRRYFACFDLVHGEPDIAPGILTSIDEAPYNNIVASENGCTFTEFDFNKKSIHIFEQLGCCASVETWCEYESANEWWKPKVVVVKKIRRETNSEGTTVKTYTRQNDELKLLNTTLERF